MSKTKTSRRFNAKSKPAGAPGAISRFVEHHYRHFNAAALVDAAKAYRQQLDDGNHMMITLAGAMSTAELGLSLAEMIRQNKVHLICCTGANLEEDVFNLVAHDYYERVPNYRELSPKRRGEVASAPSQPRHRHLHSRTRSHAADGEGHARGLDGGGQEGRTVFPA